MKAWLYHHYIECIANIKIEISKWTEQRRIPHCSINKKNDNEKNDVKTLILNTEDFQFAISKAAIKVS